MPKTVKIQRSGNALVVTIPRAVADMLTLQEGDMMEVMLTGGMISYQKARESHSKKQHP